jgi:hypothetical protein
MHRRLGTAGPEERQGPSLHAETTEWSGGPADQLWPRHPSTAPRRRGPRRMHQARPARGRRLRAAPAAGPVLCRLGRGAALFIQTMGGRRTRCPRAPLAPTARAGASTLKVFRGPAAAPARCTHAAAAAAAAAGRGLRLCPGFRTGCIAAGGARGRCTRVCHAWGARALPEGSPPNQTELSKGSADRPPLFTAALHGAACPTALFCAGRGEMQAWRRSMGASPDVRKGPLMLKPPHHNVRGLYVRAL